MAWVISLEEIVMFRSLHSKLLTFFLALSLGGILLVGMAIYFGVQETFQDYLETKRREQVSQMTIELEKEFRTEGIISGESVSIVMNHYGVQEQLFFEIYDSTGQLIIDSSQMSGDMNHRHMMGESMRNVDIHSELFDKEDIPLVVNEEQIGAMRVFYPATFIQTDVEFLTQFNKYLIGAVVIMTILSFILSFIFSKRLSRGLKQIGQATRDLKKHHLDVRIPIGHHVKEIEELSHGFNELADSLRQSEELRKQFTSDLAHELRTPLATLRSQLESFQDGIFEPTPERLNQCHNELMRLVRLVNEMEKLHAAENPQIHLNFDQINSKDVLQALYDRFHVIFKNKGITFSVENNKSYTFTADIDRFIQIMTNLLNNSLKYTDPGGNVQIQVEQDKEGTHFSIKDTGQGMTEEELNYMYERFYRGEKSRNPKTGGLGIGLSIVKALVEAHKAIIKVESHKESGTTIVVTFK